MDPLRARISIGVAVVGEQVTAKIVIDGPASADEIASALGAALGQAYVLLTTTQNVAPSRELRADVMKIIDGAAMHRYDGVMSGGVPLTK